MFLNNKSVPMWKEHLLYDMFLFSSEMAIHWDCPDISGSEKVVYTQCLSASLPVSEEKYNNFALTERKYGKNSIKLLTISHQGKLHTIQELEVDTRLQLDSDKDYCAGDNGSIVATDSQKNIIYVLAKQHGVKSPEEFGKIVCEFFLSQYQHVVEVSVHVELYPWQRMQTGHQHHNHAFVMMPTAHRHANVTLKRHGRLIIESGLTGLRVLKTTQSAFFGYIKDEFTTLAETNDRLLSTIVTASWSYIPNTNVDYCKVWSNVKDCILEKFAGPPEDGIYSPSVQYTMYIAQQLVLDRISQISSITLEMPNKHYFPVDWSKMPELQLDGNRIVLQPVDKPAGLIQATLERRPKSKI